LLRTPQSYFVTFEVYFIQLEHSPLHLFLARLESSQSAKAFFPREASVGAKLFSPAFSFLQIEIFGFFYVLTSECKTPSSSVASFPGTSENLLFFFCHEPLFPHLGPLLDFSGVDQTFRRLKFLAAIQLFFHAATKAAPSCFFFFPSCPACLTGPQTFLRPGVRFPRFSFKAARGPLFSLGGEVFRSLGVYRAD